MEMQEFREEFYRNVKNGDFDIALISQKAEILGKNPSISKKNSFKIYLGNLSISDEWNIEVTGMGKTYKDSVNYSFGGKRDVFSEISAFSDTRTLGSMIRSVQQKKDGNECENHCWISPSINAMKKDGNVKRLVPQIDVEHYTFVLSGEIVSLDEDRRKVNVNMIYAHPSQNFFEKIYQSVNHFKYNLDDLRNFYKLTRRASSFLMAKNENLK